MRLRIGCCVIYLTTLLFDPHWPLSCCPVNMEASCSLRAFTLAASSTCNTPLSPYFCMVSCFMSFRSHPKCHSSEQPLQDFSVALPTTSHSVWYLLACLLSAPPRWTRTSSSWEQEPQLSWSLLYPQHLECIWPMVGAQQVFAEWDASLSLRCCLSVISFSVLRQPKEAPSKLLQDSMPLKMPRP